MRTVSRPARPHAGQPPACCANRPVKALRPGRPAGQSLVYCIEGLSFIWPRSAQQGSPQGRVLIGSKLAQTRAASSLVHLTFFAGKQVRPLYTVREQNNIALFLVLDVYMQTAKGKDECVHGPKFKLIKLPVSEM